MFIYINGKKCLANAGETIFLVAKREGIEIPTLCHLKHFSPTSSCRVCLVEVAGQRNLVTACSFKVSEGMEVLTNSPKVLSARKLNLELLLSAHNYDCENCFKAGSCELEKLAQEYKVDGKMFGLNLSQAEQVDDSSPCIERDNSKCILCKRCVAVCKAQSVGVIRQNYRGFKTQIGCEFGKGIGSSLCVGCGQCVKVCPTGALRENLSLRKLQEILGDKTKRKIVAPAPAVRVAIMEEFGLTPKEAEGILPTLFKKLGFDQVFDVNFGADLVAIEEAEEFVKRIKTNKQLPLFTSCCPAWVDFAEKFYPEYKVNISTCKSPMLALSEALERHYATNGTKPQPKSFVAVMPCTAKKAESLKLGSGVDAVITVNELLYLVKKFRIDVKKLKPSEFDPIFGESSGAGVIFGRTGGVAEAVVRAITGEAKPIEFSPIPNINGAKIATIKMGKCCVNIAVVSGLIQVRALLEKIKRKEITLHLVEVMACAGGCINGGGMPRRCGSLDGKAVGLAELDKSRANRFPQENKEVQDYLNFIKKR